MSLSQLLDTLLAPAREHTLDSVGRTVLLPLPLRSLLARTNGGQLRSTAVLRLPDGSTAGAIALVAAEELAHTTTTLLGSGSDHVAWARDGNGNALLMDGTGRVSFWDHDTDQITPLGCGLDDLPQLFEQREDVRRPLAWEATASPVLPLLERQASLAEILRVLDSSLSRDTARAFLFAAINYGRGDVIDAVAASAHARPALGEALHLASRQGRTDIMRTLMARGADPDARKGAEGNTPLMSAASAGKAEAVELLVELGADPGLRNEQGKDAEQIARLAKRARIESFLKRAKGA